MERRRDRGSGSVLTASIAVLVVLVAVLVARVAVAAAQQAAAQHAADAAALAGVRGGRSAAEQLATANGAELVAFHAGPGRAGGTVRVAVTVRRGDREAAATAEGDRWPRAVGGGTPRATGVLYAQSLCPMATSVRRPLLPQITRRLPMVT